MVGWRYDRSLWSLVLDRSAVVVGGEVVPLIKCVHFNPMTGQIGEKEDTGVVTCIGSVSGTVEDRRVECHVQNSQ